MGMVPRKNVLQVGKVSVTDGANLLGSVVARVEVPLEVQVQHRQSIPAGGGIPSPLSLSCQVEFLQCVEQLPDIGFLRISFWRNPFPKSIQEAESHFLHLSFYPAVVNDQQVLFGKSGIHDFIQVHRNLVPMDGAVLF